MNFHIRIKGVVQGVGFRPFVYRLAKKHNLAGRVFNDSQGVIVEVEAASEEAEKFISEIKSKAPSNAVIKDIILERTDDDANLKTFSIEPSSSHSDKETLIANDSALCPDCLTELLNSKNRRFEYPFINCTNCGPRFTIIKDVPYDRKRTTMSGFKMCNECAREYTSETDRRFHAEPIACAKCGPRISAYDKYGKLQDNINPIQETVRILKNNGIAAIKGLGGYHLACGAENTSAIEQLRRVKTRPSKPFAVIAKNIKEIEQFCLISKEEIRLLLSPSAPIVLLKKKHGSKISPSVSPGNNYFGVMLAYTPLHRLLLEETDMPLTMTSGNISGEPIIQNNEEAWTKLKFANIFLTHNRDICNPCDDSVAFHFRNKPRLIRRARGYAPLPIQLPFSSEKQILGCGANQKNTFALCKGNKVFLSQHIGELDNYETLKRYEETIVKFKALFDIEPKTAVCDKHPDYASTGYALDLKKKGAVEKVISVQHHKAHIASCMAENSVAPDQKIIGVAFDGSGFGDDGNIWGGEFFFGTYTDMKRAGHLEYVPMPGGEKAVKEIWRMGYAYLYHTNLQADLRQCAISEMLKKGINSPRTSSVGRLFDGVSALIGLRREVHYEAQAAIELEALARENITDAYHIDITEEDGFILKIGNLIEEILRDIDKKTAPEIISSRFHNGLANAVIEVCIKIGNKFGSNITALSGGVFQNRYLLNRIYNGLTKNKFQVLLHSQVPCNDGGISLGQTAIVSLPPLPPNFKPPFPPPHIFSYNHPAPLDKLPY